MLDEMTLKIVSGILVILVLAASVRFTSAARAYTAPFKKMKNLAKAKGISSFPRSAGLNFLRELNHQISTDESAKLFSQAESAAPRFVMGLRVILVLFVPLLICLAFMKYQSGQ